MEYNLMILVDLQLQLHLVSARRIFFCGGAGLFYLLIKINTQQFDQNFADYIILFQMKKAYVLSTIVIWFNNDYNTL